MMNTVQQKKYNMSNKLIACILCGLLAAFVVFLRIRLVSLPQLDKIAKAQAYKEAGEKIRNSINEKYAAFPQQKRDELTNRAYKKYLKSDRYAIKEKIRRIADEKKAFYRNDKGSTYLFGIDSYYWLRLIDNLINKGHIGDRVVGGRQHDDLVDMSIEDSLSRSVHLIAGKLFYDAFHLLKIDVDYERGLFLIPLLFSVFMVITSFFVTRLLCHSNRAAFFSAVAVNCSPLLLHRTMGEWLDTDIYNVFFPLLIFSAFLFVFKSRSVKRKIAGTAGFAVSCALFAGVWQGWWFIFDLLMLCGGIFFLNDYAERRDKALLKNNMLWLALLCVAGCLSVGLLNGKESLLSFLIEPARLVFALKDVPHDNWPNVFLTVAELKKVSAYQIAYELGGVPIFFVTIVGSIYLILAKKIMRDPELGIGFFCLFIWLGALYYTSLNALRFALLLVVPLGIMFGIVFDWMMRGVFDLSRRFSRTIRFLGMGIIAAALYLVTSFYITTSVGLAGTRLPMMNDAWYKSLLFIKQDSDEKAIINSWWDYGHWFKAVAGRRVLFDGKTQNSPIAYWMASVLLSANEDEAMGILRMLDLSKNKAFEALESAGISHVRSVEILRHILPLPKQEAVGYLKDVLARDAIDKLMPLLYSDTMPPAYFIVSYDMLGKLGAISLIGNWNFTKGDIWIAFREKRPADFMRYLMREYDYDTQAAQRTFQEVSLITGREAPRWISDVSGLAVETISNKYKKDGTLVFFDNGAVVNLDNCNAHIMRGKNNDIGIPFSVVYMKDGMVEEKLLEESNMPQSLLLLSDTENDSYKTVFIDRDLAKSMFVRLYFYNGAGLRYFAKAREEKTLEGNSIFVYAINWPKNE